MESWLKNQQQYQWDDPPLVGVFYWFGLGYCESVSLYLRELFTFGIYKCSFFNNTAWMVVIIIINLIVNSQFDIIRYYYIVCLSWFGDEWEWGWWCDSYYSFISFFLSFF